MNKMRYIVISITLFIIVFILLEYTLHQLSPIENIRSRKIDTIHFRTGDLILYNSCFELKYDVYKLFCYSRYTHVALVFVDSAGTVFQIETNGKHGNKCERINPAALKNHVIRQINKPLDSKKMEAYLHILIGQKYSYDLWKSFYRKWFRFIPLPVKQQVVFTKAFCSELISLILTKFGVLCFDDHELQPSLVLPGDFSLENESKLPFVNGYKYGEEILIS